MKEKRKKGMNEGGQDKGREGKGTDEEVLLAGQADEGAEKTS